MTAGGSVRGRLAAALLAAAAALAAAPAAPGEKEALDALRKRLEHLRSEIASAEGSRTEAADQLRESESAISEANRALAEIGNALAAARAELRAVEAEAARVGGEKAVREAELARMLHARYVAHRPGPLALLLSGEDPNRIARELVYAGYLSRAHAELVRALETDRQRLTELAERAREKDTELASLERAQRAERERLVREQAARRAVLARVSDQLRKQRRELATLERDEKRLERLVANLARAARPPVPAPPRGEKPLARNDKVPEPGAEAGVFSALKGRLRLPVRGELSGRYGAPREGGLAWKGLFLRAPEGEEVRAVAAGRVVFADWLRGFGNLLVLDHGQGYLTIYGHNQAVLKRPGDAVHGGEVVATVGATGGAEESGLYFEIRDQGRPVDPMAWVNTR
ncbi:MAG: peptidoglycan DD-metalloendopeptidase family protein [Burkholderiales bacterium]|nr:peptidoglycan DD-metalloendopeptidase family protein [Burkholderiales bacterium]